MSENVRTYLRIRPQEVPEDFEMTGTTMRLGGDELVFDGIFKDSTQQEVFQELSRNFLVECMQGYNCTLFAYGQTGSGKTYTMEGNSHRPGLVQRSLCFLHQNTDLEISLSFVEIYNETMVDLFNPGANLTIREDPFDGVVVDNLSVVRSCGYEESMELYCKGTGARRTSSTAMNRESSRSHSVFTVTLRSSGGVVSKCSKLCFVDLAGSERLREREMEDERLKETANINKSLLCLGKVINKLSSGENGHIGYRESKLTFLLKDSLGGNCKLTIIGSVSLEHRSDSLNTINFLRRSRMIRNPAVANSEVRGELEEVKNKLKAVDKENQSLKARLALAGGRHREETVDLPSYYYDIKQTAVLVEDIVARFHGLEETVRRMMNADFDRSRSLLLRLNDSFLSMCKEVRGSIGTATKKRRRDESD